MNKFLRFELKRALNSKLLLAILLGLTVFVLGFSINSAIKADTPTGGTKTIYGISEYETQDELLQAIHTMQEALDDEQTRLNQGLQNNSLNENQTDSMRQNIEYMQTYLQASNELYSNKIPFSQAESYMKFNEKNGASGVIQMIGVVSLVLGLCCALKIAVSIPSEIKDGQAKTTFLFPVGKVRYSLMRLLSDTLKFLIVFAILLCLIIACGYIFFEHSGYYVVVANENFSALLTLPTAALFTAGFGIFYLICCSLIAYAVSLLIKSVIASAVLTIFLCLSGHLISLFDSMLSGMSTFSKYILFCTMNADKVFYEYGANPVWISVLIVLAYLIPITAISLFKFQRDDVK